MDKMCEILLDTRQQTVQDSNLWKRKQKSEPCDFPSVLPVEFPGHSPRRRKPEPDWQTSQADKTDLSVQGHEGNWSSQDKILEKRKQYKECSGALQRTPLGLQLSTDQQVYVEKLPEARDTTTRKEPDITITKVHTGTLRVHSQSREILQ